MPYLQVQNTGEIPLSGIRVLGLSKKSKEQIGQFGTGLKESIALLIRKGKSPIIFSGLNKIIFSIQDIEGNDEICFKIEGTGTERFPAGVWHGMGMSPGFGKLDWISPWQVLREIFCNAYDEGYMQYDLTNNLQGEAGFTKVYLEADIEIMDEYKILPNKLLFMGNRKPFESNDIGSIYQKSGSKKAQIYTKGVWVQQHGDESIFDYEFKDLKLNESRSADWYTCFTLMAQVINSSSTAIREILTQVYENKDFNKTIEGNHFSYFYSFNTNKSHRWENEFTNLFGPTAVAVCTQHHLEVVIRKGYKPVVFEEGIYGTLKSLGVPSASSILSDDESDGTQILPTSIKTTKLFDKIWTKLNKEGLTRSKVKPSLKTFSMVGSEGSDLKLGFFRDNTVYLNVRIVNSREEITTIIEEIAHCCSDAADCSRDFQNYLLDCLVTLNF